MAVTLQNVFPPKLSLYKAYRCLGNVIHTCQLRLTEFAVSYVNDRIFRKFRLREFFSSFLSFFINHIARVIGLRAEKQVRWVNAIWHIARVQNAHTSRYLSKMYLPRSSMCADKKSSFAQISITHDRPVPKFIFATSPKPAAFRFNCFGKKPILQWLEDFSLINTFGHGRIITWH